jgi:hypothetical protein
MLFIMHLSLVVTDWVGRYTGSRPYKGDPLRRRLAVAACRGAAPECLAKFGRGHLVMLSNCLRIIFSDPERFDRRYRHALEATFTPLEFVCMAIRAWRGDHVRPHG